MADIHYRKIGIQEYLQKVKDSDVDEENKKLIFAFDKQNTAEGVSDSRRLTYVMLLAHICGTRCAYCGTLKSAKSNKSNRWQKCKHKFDKRNRWLNKSFRKAAKEDIVTVMQKIEGKGFAAWTLQNYKIALKKFYKWLKPQSNSREYPKEVAWIKTTIKDKDRKLPEEMLTTDEVKKLAGITDNIRDRALILALYESGCRPEELMSLQYKNVIFDKYGAVFIVNGKRGMRRVRLIVASSALAEWKSSHPTKNPDDPLWTNRVHKGKSVRCTDCSHAWIAIAKSPRCPKCRSYSIEELSEGRLYAPLTYNGLYSLLTRLLKRAGIKKRCHPYLFRHSRATELAKSLKEAQLKELFGWTQSSNAAATYVHLSGRDVDDTLLRLHGLLEETEKEDGFKGIKCPRCKQVNLPKSAFCSNCGMALDIKTVMEIGETDKKIINELSRRIPGFEDLTREIVNEMIAKGEIRTSQQEA